MSEHPTDAHFLFTFVFKQALNVNCGKQHGRQRGNSVFRVCGLENPDLFQDSAVCAGGSLDLVVVIRLLAVRDGVRKSKIDRPREAVAPVPAMR